MNQFKFIIVVFTSLLSASCSDRKIESQEDDISNSIEPPVLTSVLEIYDLDTEERSVVYSEQTHFEAPNWTKDGNSLIFNEYGKLYTIPTQGGDPKELDTDFADNCNNDHGISPDGRLVVISHHEKESNNSTIYTLPIEGGKPTQITQNGPSYWHGWSPDGKTLAYCAERDGLFDIYTIPVEGGEETRLTNADGLDDGPDYSPDGKYIYFNSIRTGIMQIWRMKTDGTKQEQITTDKYNDWFAHPSPDGSRIVFVSYEPEVDGHPANQDVQLRIMDLETKKVETVCKLFGGQGTINVPSWSPNGRKFAFVSYDLLE